MFFPSQKRKCHLPTINLQVLCKKRDRNSFFAKDSPRSNPNRSAVHRDVDVSSFEVSSEASTKSTTACDVDQNGFQCLENKSSQIAGSQFLHKMETCIYIYDTEYICLFFQNRKHTYTIYIYWVSPQVQKKICWFQARWATWSRYN